MANAGTLIPIKSAGCGQLAKGFYNKGLLEDEYHIKKGDIVFFNWDNGETPSDYVPFPSVDHVGIVVSVGSNGDFVSVEGNTGGTNNGEVLKQNRNISKVSCVAHPQYNSTFTADMIIKTALAEVGTKATNIKVCKYNTWFYGFEVSGTIYDWCAAFVCWVFYHTESSSGGSGGENYGKVKTVLYLRVLGKNYENREGQVKNLQRILNACGYKGKDGKVLVVDGIFGDNTEYALKSWQKKHGLKVDGVFKEIDQDDFYSTDP